MPENNNKIRNQVLLFVGVFAIAFAGTQFAMSFFRGGNSKLIEVAQELNKKGPQLIDPETRIDSTTAAGDTLVYHYSLVNMSKKDTTVNFEGAKAYIQQQAQTNFDTNTKMNELREMKVKLKYEYKDKDGQSLFNFTITATKTN
jgi:hypothetical protein